MSRQVFKFTLATLLAAVLGIYLWNAWQYSVWSSYDGGAHIDYIFTLADAGKLPEKSDNYLAWHEPLYYGINALVVKALKPLEFSRSGVNKLLQLENALIAFFIVLGSSALSWLASRRQWITLLVTITTGLLFVVGAVGRYITNEALLHALIILWLAWFSFWEMERHENWSSQRWLLLSFGLGAVVLTKLTGFILVMAVAIWLLIYAVSSRQWRAIAIAAIMLTVVFGLYAPWFYHKARMYGNALTVNSFETDSGREQETRVLPARFFSSWDNGVISHPFWTSGRGSFWSIFYGSAFGDYDNIFQNYEAHKTSPRFVTANGRTMTTSAMAYTLALFWWSLPLVFWVIAGCALYLWKAVRRWQINNFLLPLVAGGLLLGLMYNVYKYPYLERGTLKAIFIVSFFPLALILASIGWGCPRAVKHCPRGVLWLAYGYIIVWCVLSAFVIILPA